MFSNFTKKDLYFFGPKMLEKASLKVKGKERNKKIIVPRIEEIMAEIKVIFENKYKISLTKFFLVRLT